MSCNDMKDAFQRPVPRVYDDCHQVTFSPGSLIGHLGPLPSSLSACKWRIDNVNSPQHYNRKGIEAIDAIEAALSEEEFLGYLRGNILKYNWRCRYKGKTIEDIEKAEWYSNKLKEKLIEYGKA